MSSNHGGKGRKDHQLINIITGMETDIVGWHKAWFADARRAETSSVTAVLSSQLDVFECPHWKQLCILQS